MIRVGVTTVAPPLTEGIVGIAPVDKLMQPYAIPAVAAYAVVCFNAIIGSCRGWYEKDQHGENRRVRPYKFSNYFK
jgi:hypothetical protein